MAANHPGPVPLSTDIPFVVLATAPPPAEGLLGEAAALAAASCWVLTAMAFTAAGRRVGVTTVNLVRIVAAFLILSGIVAVRFGTLQPDVPGRSVLLFVISGIIGLSVGDQLFFGALVRIGPRIGTLIGTTTAPPIATLIAWHFLDESLGLRTLAALVLILIGIAWVLAARVTPAAGDDPAAATSASDPPPAAGRGIGIAMAMGAGVCQAVGLVIAKRALGHGEGAAAPVDPWIATWIRMGAAVPGILVFSWLLRRVWGPRAPRPPLDRRDRRIAWSGIAIGTLFGPVAGVWFSMVAVDHAEAGVAATLMAMSPILILPLAVLIERERLGPAAIAGSAVAVLGVAVLSWPGPAADPAGEGPYPAVEMGPDAP